MTGLAGPPGLLLGALLQSASCAAAVLLPVRSALPVLCWLGGCWLLYRAGAALRGAAEAPTAAAWDRAARTRLLRSVHRLAGSGHHHAWTRLQPHLYAAAGVAIRWEPKPGLAAVRLTDLAARALTVAGLCAALAVTAPATAPASALAPGLCALGALGLALRPRGPGTRGTGRAGWSARRRESRVVAVLAGALAAGAALAPALAAADRPDAPAGPLLAAVALVPSVYRLGRVDLSAVRHRRLTQRHLSAVERAAARTPEPADTPHGGPVAVPARPGRLGFTDLAENIHLGALAGDDPLPGALPHTVRLCGLEELARTLPHGWRTVLSAEFSGGVDLDEADWRRIGAARVSARIEAGATTVRLTAEPDPLLAAVLADWNSRTGVRVLPPPRTEQLDDTTGSEDTTAEPAGPPRFDAPAGRHGAAHLTDTRPTGNERLDETTR
ncbi:hypothetical protein ACFYT4_14815 [Streptomyces sp. NPDC004609]|uniref:hypothetical protein n=1 Tax=Streptomyces sp. NPDC004609 TaxID=3364704 RepID=UPI00369578E8